MMNVLVLSSSPNEDGLTAACAAAATEGVRLAGGTVEAVLVNDQRVGMCQACDDAAGKGGWGTCRLEHRCQVEDGFQALHARILAADALVLVTPVYWGDMSESMKALTDRLRRCEAPRRAESGLAGKQVLCIAAAGGSGNGTITWSAGISTSRRASSTTSPSIAGAGPTSWSLFVTLPRL
jgi:multimeric flavodoxin WrbA